MENRNQKAFIWLKNRLKRKYKIKPQDTEKVLGAIGDLIWDWKDSKYDIWGLGILEILLMIGKKRCPKDRKKDLSI
jgi:hypothetical protein